MQRLTAGVGIGRAVAVLSIALLGVVGAVLCASRPALAEDGTCPLGPPRSAWVETSVTIAERGHDAPTMTSTTRVGVPRDWAGAAGLLGDGSAAGCLFPAGGTRSVSATVPVGGTEVVVQTTEETRLESYGTEWGAETAGLWQSRESGGVRFVALLPSLADLPPGLAQARWRTVTVKAPDLAVRRVTPLPSAASPGHVYVWRDAATPPRVEVALPLSARSAFQRWVGLQAPRVFTTATYLGFALPYLLLAGFLAVLHRRSGDRDERRLVRIALVALAMVTAADAVLFVGPLTGGLLLAVDLALLDAAADAVVVAALCLAAWRLTRSRVRRAGLVIAAVAGLALPLIRFLVGEVPDAVRVASTVVTALLLTGAAWAIAVRAAHVPGGRTPRAVHNLLRWTVPGLALLTLSIAAHAAVTGLLDGVLPPFFLLGNMSYLLWPLIVLLLLLLLRLHGRRTDSVGSSTVWLVVFLFVVGTIRWPGTYAGVPVPLAALVGLAALPLLLRLTRRGEVADPEVSRRRLAVIVDEYRDLEAREKGLRKRWAAGEIDDADYHRENAPVVDRIRGLRGEIGLDPDREDGLSPLDVALSRGPGGSWWANARLAARYASFVGAPAAVFLIWATWSTDSQGHDGWLDRLRDPHGFYGLAGDLIGGLLIWPVAGFVLGALWRRLPGRRGYLKGVVPVLAYAAATGAHAALNNFIGQAPVRGSLVRVLLLFLVLTVVAVLMDARTLQTRPGGLASRLTPVAVVYRLGTAGSGIALIVAQAAAVLGLWTQLRNGIDITSQVDTSSQASLGTDAQVFQSRVDR